jgi:hypothetical protein
MNKFLNKFRPVIVFLLNLAKKMRGFDPSFSVYFPNANISRELFLWKLKVLNPLLNIDVNFKARKCEIPLDIYIPASLKDIETLPKVIEGVLKNIKHPITKIYIIAEESNKIKAFCTKYHAEFINEFNVLGYTKNAINYLVDDVDRSGWLYQQLLKLNADSIVKEKYFLILDADTVFIKPKIFIYKNKMILDHSEERHEAYHTAYQKILNQKTSSELSFITHYMLFDRMLLLELKQKIALLHDMKWDDVILRNTDYTNSSGFSEYELYGNFLLEKYPHLIKREYWFNVSGVETANPSYIKSISLHSYLKKSY